MTIPVSLGRSNRRRAFTTAAFALVALLTLLAPTTGELAADVPPPGTGLVTLLIGGKQNAVEAAQIGLLDEEGNDLVPGCERVPGWWLTLHCNWLPDGYYTPTLFGPDWISWQVRCSPGGTANVHVAGPYGREHCYITVWPADGSGDVDAYVEVTLETPAHLADTVDVQLVWVNLPDDESTTPASGCTTLPGPPRTLSCHPPSGMYRVHTVNVPPGADLDGQCVGFPTPAALGGILITTATFTVECTVGVSTPTIRVRVENDEIGGGTDGVVVQVDGGSGSRTCTPVRPTVWECVDLPPGDYQVRTNLAELGKQPTPVWCRPILGGPTAPPPARIGTSGLRFILCGAGYRFSSSEEGGTDETSSLPVSGSAATELLVGGLAVVSLGAVLMLVAGAQGGAPRGRRWRDD